jgi:tetratricopeptide (TPR) repeat protein/transcriptional regulator with XRE-family HTH domain
MEDRTAMARREPNVRLRALAQEAGWSGAELARAVNRAGAESGVELRYDRTSVAHWMAGTRPPAAVAALVAEALARGLGRRVTLADTGFAPLDSPVPGVTPDHALATADTFNQAATLTALDRSRALPYRRELDEPDPVHTRPYHPVSAPPTRRVEAAHVRSAQAMLHSFAAVDTSFGGGHSRSALTGYLRCSVAEWLESPAAPRVRRDLLVVASQLASLAGFMCFDVEHQGTAQAYYRTAARLAAEADDASGQAAALRALSMQAHHLGHRPQALELAEAAAAHAPRLPPVRAAAVFGQLAVAAAGRGDQRRALDTLARSSELLARADSGGSGGSGDGDVDGDGYHEAAHESQQAQVFAALGDVRAAIGALRRSLQRRPAHERRARAVTTDRLGTLLLEAGNLEQACASWHDFLDDYPLLHSGRADRALRSLRGRLRPFRTSVAGRTVLARSEPLMARSSRSPHAAMAY